MLKYESEAIYHDKPWFQLIFVKMTRCVKIFSRVKNNATTAKLGSYFS